MVDNKLTRRYLRMSARSFIAQNGVLIPSREGA
jgi:hypothetical protein